MMLAMVVWSQVFAVAYVIGPATGGVVADALGYEAIGLVPLAAGLAVWVALLRLPRGTPAAVTDESAR
jgi:predicted MFS family arabinose efflux permease